MGGAGRKCKQGEGCVIPVQHKEPKKIIIFDMDNTLLRSSIDFTEMKREVCRRLEQAGIEADTALPVAQIIQSSRSHPRYHPDIEASLWQLVNEVEAKGMEKAVLEPGIIPVLARLGQKAGLMLLSNNLHANLEWVLEEWSLDQYFLAIAGRDEVEELKPLPHGYLYLMSLYPQHSPADFLAIGDAAIDLLAAQAAGIPFVAYNNSRQEDWSSLSPKPLAYLENWGDAACSTIEDLLFGGNSRP